MKFVLHSAVLRDIIIYYSWLFHANSIPLNLRRQEKFVPQNLRRGRYQVDLWNYLFRPNLKKGKIQWYKFTGNGLDSESLNLTSWIIKEKEKKWKIAEIVMPLRSRINIEKERRSWRKRESSKARGLNVLPFLFMIAGAIIWTKLQELSPYWPMPNEITLLPGYDNSVSKPDSRLSPG